MMASYQPLASHNTCPLQVGHDTGEPALHINLRLPIEPDFHIQRHPVCMEYIVVIPDAVENLFLIGEIDPVIDRIIPLGIETEIEH